MGTVVNESNQQNQIDKSKRKWIYAKKPSGQFFNYRQVVGYGLLLFFFLGPILKINGNPFLMFNIIERKFSIFGNIFYPQDFHIFLFGMLIVLVCIVLFTAVYGRVWCGWTCPQTIFMELIFRRIEYLIEGDWTQQKKLNEGPDTDVKAWKKFLKHTVFLLISFIISNLFLSYIIGVDALYKIVTDPVENHIVGFLSIIVFTLVFYFVFAFVREIVCTRICPYGRLQGVLLDDNSVTVAYNVKRGEPRGKIRKDSSEEKGDCIDCNLCVNVCPTGIDIRKGPQLECVSCTACIDACDAVMDKIDKPRRLIGFYTLAEAEGTETEDAGKRKNTRAVIYTGILVVLMGIFGFMIFSRSDVDGRLLRAKGSTYQKRDDGTVTNLYTLEVINKTSKDLDFDLVSATEGVNIQVVNPISHLNREGSAKLSLFLIADQQSIKQYKTDVKVDIKVGDKVLETMETTFIAPPAKK